MPEIGWEGDGYWTPEGPEVGHGFRTAARAEARPWWLQLRAITATTKSIEITRTSVSAIKTRVRVLFNFSRAEQGQGPMAQPIDGASAQSLGQALTSMPPTARLFEPQFQELVMAVEARVDADLPTLERNLSVNREAALRYAVMDFSSALYLERASRFLFGSQIDAIIFLGVNGGRGTRQEVEKFYQTATTQYPDFYVQYSFEQWLGFLITWGLVERTNDAISLSGGGKAMIPYLNSRNYLATRAPG